MEEVARRPGVSAEDVEAVLRVHVDRVHDAVRRLGADPDTAVEVVRTSALSLVDAVATRPQDVPDAVGWWFAEARRRAGGTGSGLPDLPLGGGLLSADDDQLVLAETIEELPEDERLALLLRDAYRLPMSAVAGGLGTDESTAATIVARARLHAVPLLDDEPAPPLPAHAESVAALGRVGESGQVAPRDATVRRHVQACAACRAVTDSQQRVHLLLGGLAVVALPDAVRAEVLAQAEDKARTALPAAAALVLTEEEWEEQEEARRVLSPVMAVLGVVLAVGLGTGVGVVLSRGASAVLPVSSNVLPEVALPEVEAPAPITLPADLPPPPPVPEPRTSVFTLPPRTAAPAPPPPEQTTAPTAAASPTATTPAGAQTLTVDPASGPNGATLTVTGAGWTPGARVVIEYLDPTGRPTGSRATATVDADGDFTTELVARNPTGVPGRHTVQASEGSRTRSASYDATA
ncbi:MAG TPA: sigma factor-like helix-turn-helix DNA-binding protein [Mycobacteriales bacterium]|nr:sigma factor-like helix-turn-helix DNA-binding protein [Mycobacteriales bacterium]